MDFESDLKYMLLEMPPLASCCRVGEKNVKPYHRDSNQGPSAYQADVLWFLGLTFSLKVAPIPKQLAH